MMTEAEMEYNRLLGFFPRAIDLNLTEAFSFFAFVKGRRKCPVQVK